MIQPDEIRRKAENFYGQFLRAWVAGEPFFPRVIPARKDPGGDLAAAIQAVRTLRERAKESIGYGYSIEWREVNSRRFGRNLFPTKILFETRDDYLRFIGKTRDFQRFAEVVKEIRHRYPALTDWVSSNTALLSAIAPDLPGLLNVLDVLSTKPRPGCFIRELLISEDSKFIERHKPLLRQWLDRVLPPHAIRADEEHFERRYGMRYAEPHLMIRFLDESLQREVGFPCDTLSLPLHTLGEWRMPEANVFIVENKINLLTIPSMDRTIGLGALGKAVPLLRYLPWLAHARITYWGDLDVEGLCILSELRALFPQTRSLFMDEEALHAWRPMAVPGTKQTPSTPANLTASEKHAFALCREHNLRVEQERIPQAAVRDALLSIARLPSCG